VPNDPLGTWARAWFLLTGVLVLFTALALGSLVKVRDFSPDLSALVLVAMVCQSVALILLPNSFGQESTRRIALFGAATVSCWLAFMFQAAPAEAFPYLLGALFVTGAAILWHQRAVSTALLISTSLVYAAGPSAFRIGQESYRIPFGDYIVFYWMTAVGLVWFALAVGAGRRPTGPAPAAGQAEKQHETG
jgi:hypothetical protein